MQASARAKVAKHKSAIMLTTLAAETAGAAFAGGAAAGYLGPENVKIFGFDGRLAIGVVGMGFSLMQAFRGKKSSAHVLALSTGLAASGLAALGYEYGAKYSAGGAGFAGAPQRPAYRAQIAGNQPQPMGNPQMQGAPAGLRYVGR
jgi:hypothetical protein